MLLLIDIGNTNIDLMVTNPGGRAFGKYSATTKKLNIDSILLGIKNRIKIDKIIIVSVVPRALRKIKASVKRIYKGKHVLVVGKNVKVPLKCEYNKREIGQDRLITANAAKNLYGLPVLIIDFGTAVTFDVVSKKAAYSGGLILPGIKMSLESLSERAAMLPKTHLKRTRSFMGKNTRSSIRNGMIYGYAAMCDGLIEMFIRKYGKGLKIVATGGDAPLISRYTRSIKKVDPNLSLKGLFLLTKT